MKMVVAIIQPDKLEDVRQSLMQVDVPRVTVSRCTGHGNAQDMSLYRGQEITPDLLAKVRLEIAVNDEFVDPTVQAIIRGAKHGDGKLGDGKIFVMPLEQVIRIRTEEDGKGAI